MNTDSQYLFVYGTLMSGYDDKESHNHLIKYAHLIGKATMQGKMYMVDYYPGVIASDEEYIVRGELYKIDDTQALFSFLDKYEEYDPINAEKSEYRRGLTKVLLNNSHEIIEAWIYYYNQSINTLELLPKGDFLNEYHK